MTLDYASLELPDPPADRPYAAINMVMTADGRTVVGGTERGIGSAADQRLMRELRVHFDVVLNGGGTFRASGTSARLGREDLWALRVSRGLPPSPIAAVLTRSGDLPAGRRFFTDDSFEAVIYLASDAPAGALERLAALGRPVVVVPAGRAPAGALEHMRDELGARRVLAEGGARLNGELLRAGLVDEFFLTLAPRIAGGGGQSHAVAWDGAAAVEAMIGMDLVSAVPCAETGEVFLRYRVRSG